MSKRDKSRRPENVLNIFGHQGCLLLFVLSVLRVVHISPRGAATVIWGGERGGKKCTGDAAFLKCVRYAHR